MKNIKAIIFDLGGVILNIDYKLTINEFRKLGVKKSTEFYSKKNQNKIFDFIEKGEITEEEFIEKLQEKTDRATKQQVLSAWNSMILNLPIERIKYIYKIRNKYRTFLLSNTNSIHIRYFRQKIKEPAWTLFNNSFEKIYLSHKIGLRKPSCDIFNYMLKEINLNAEEVLFIDDSIQHIKSANKIGIKTYHITQAENIIQVLTDKFQITPH